MATRREGLSRKGEETRRRIFEAALSLFQERGYESTTMRAIAEAAGTSLGLTYRYYARKDELVLDLYRSTCVAFEEAVRALPPGPLSERFAAAMETKLALVEPHRAVFAAVFATSMNPRSQAFALGEAAADIRARVVSAWQVVVDGARDAAELEKKRELATLLFVAQLAVLFFWMYDESPGEERTRALIAQIGGSIHMGLGLLFLPEAGERLSALVELLRPVFLAGTHAPPRP